MLTRIYGTAFFSRTDLDEPPRAARAGRGARPPPARAGARPVRVPPGGAGMPFWLPAGDGPAAPDRGARSASSSRSAATRDQDPAGARRGALAPLRPLGQLPREHVLRRARRARATAPVRAQADELPRRLPRLRLGAALLPRPAPAPGRVRPRLALRARGRPARPAARARLHPGRRPRLLHDRAGRRRGRLDLRGRSTSSTSASASTTSRSSSRPGPRSRSAPTRSGTGAEAGLREALERQGPRVPR